MIKSILVPATGSDADEAVFSSAMAVARGFAAHLNFLHVRVDAAEAAVAMASDTGGSALVGGLVERIEADADAQEARARERFQRFCEREKLALAAAPSAQPGPSAEWHVEKGREADRVIEYARAADLLVVGRPPANGEGLALDTLEAALIDSGRPMLLPGAAPLTAIPETVAIAWKPTREAAHAVTGALPFLQRAKKIVILVVAESETDADDSGGRLAAGLRWHGFAVASRRLEPGSAGTANALITAAREQQALLVMGGYGRGRLREWIFGGVTREVLDAADVPVLMAH